MSEKDWQAGFRAFASTKPHAKFSIPCMEAQSDFEADLLATTVDIILANLVIRSGLLDIITSPFQMLNVLNFTPKAVISLVKGEAFFPTVA